MCDKSITLLIRKVCAEFGGICIFGEMRQEEERERERERREREKRERERERENMYN